MVTPIDLVTTIRFSVSALKLHHTGINPDLVSVHYLKEVGGMSLMLHRASDTRIIKMGRWSSLMFLMCIHNQIWYISKVLAHTMRIPIPFLNTAVIVT